MRRQDGMRLGCSWGRAVKGVVWLDKESVVWAGMDS